MKTSLLSSPASLLMFALTACSLETADGDATLDREESEVTAACDGAACASFAAPKPLTEGGLAVHQGRLYWLAESETVQTPYGTPATELQSCQLPNCTSLNKLVVETDSAADRYDLFINHPIHAIDGGVAIFANSTIYVSDGATLKPTDVKLDTDHRARFAVDRAGFVNQRVNGTVDACALSMTGVGACQRLASPFRYSQDVGLTPTRVLVLSNSNGVASFDRATLGDRRDVSLGFRPDDANWLFTSGENIFGMWQNAGASYSSSFVTPQGGTTVPGAAYVFTAADQGRLYVGTRARSAGSRDGAVVRISATGKSQVTLATGQNPFGLVVSGSRVYWIDANVSDNPSGYRAGTVRFRSK
jgi:hypothetical protein